MFRKLVSNLPFSPSLINQLGFYSKRLHKEQVTRKIGLAFTVLAILVQSATFLIPAQPSLAAAASDIVYGGANRSAAGIINAYSNGDSLGRKDIRAIYNSYGITDNNLHNYRMERIYSSVSNNYWTTGRSARGYGGEISIQVPNGPRLYMRTLAGWSVKWWDAMRYDTPQGPRWILLGCGNIATPGNPQPQSPDLSITKTASKAQLTKGESFNYFIKVTNVGKTAATGVSIVDDAPAGIDFVKSSDARRPVTSARSWRPISFNLNPGDSASFNLTSRVTVAGPVNIVNKACVIGNNGDSNGNNNCATATVKVVPMCPIPGKQNIQQSDARCKYNPNIEIEKTTSKDKLIVGEEFVYSIKVTNKGDINLPNIVVTDSAPEHLEFLQVKEANETTFTNMSNKRQLTSKPFGLNVNQSKTIQIRAKVIKTTSVEVINQACVNSSGTNTTAKDCDDVPVTIQETCPTNPTLPKDSSECQPPCPVPGREHLPQDNPDCRPCDETKKDQAGNDISCLILKKTAKNVTQNIADANGTKANPGDVIEYTLSVKNEAKLTREGFVIEENLDDVLEYADVVDNNGGKYTGGENTKLLSWDPVDIKPGETVSKKIIIKIKSPLPITPASSSDPSSYDMRIANVYGNTVRIDLPKHPVKTLEETVRVLPSTGLGSNIVISTILIVGASYFFFRSRLMVKELGLVRKQFNYGAGA